MSDGGIHRRVAKNAEMRSIESIMIDLISPDYQQAQRAMAEIIHEPTPEAVRMICELLSSRDASVRARAASIVRELRMQEALPFLLDAIRDKRNEGNRGSLVYALQKLDCRAQFSFLFELVTTANNYEIESHALSILSGQVFDVTAQDLEIAEERLQVFRQLHVDSRPELRDLAMRLDRILHALVTSDGSVN